MVTQGEWFTWREKLRGRRPSDRLQPQERQSEALDSEGVPEDRAPEHATSKNDVGNVAADVAENDAGE